MKPSVQQHEACIDIVGQNGLHNELLASFIKDKVGFDCNCSLNFVPNIFQEENNGKKIILLENRVADMFKFWSAASNGEIMIDPLRLMIAVWNVDRDKTGLEKKALDIGLRGLFYNDTPLDVFGKGVQAIVNGELWFTRQTLSQFYLYQKHSSRASTVPPVLLSEREKSIIEKLASGASNKEIGSELCISVHTVKTHLYKIFKKINVTNRLQAIRWAEKYQL
jgi:DNA-binding NarL/FixJ family response regulator